MNAKSHGIKLLMRHGYTDYLQGNVPVAIEDANDLNQKGIDEVARSSVEIADILKHSKSIVIYSSPMGRALHTAKILREHLESQTVNVKLVRAMELQEVHNFSWDLFSEAVHLSEVDTGGHSSDDWFALDLFREKSTDTLNKLPRHLRDFVLNVETAADAKKRLLDFMDSTANTSEDAIVVTHDGLLCSLLKELSADRILTCTRSHYFEIVPSESASGWTIGRSNLG